MFRSLFGSKKAVLPTQQTALPGRELPMQGVPDVHAVNGHPLKGPWPEGFQTVMFGMGCFWGAERRFWQTPGVYSTAVGYSGGFTKNPTYDEVCSGRTGHNEVVLVVFDPSEITFNDLVTLFFESHDPTQGMRQGNDAGTQYRSGIYASTASQKRAACTAARGYGARLHGAGYGDITTEIEDAGPFYYAEAYHQQYLAKNPEGYCGLRGTGVSCPVGVFA